MSEDPPTRRRIRDVDSANRAYRLKAMSYSLVGAAFGLWVGAIIGARSQHAGLIMVVCAAGGFLFCYVISLFLGEAAGRAAGSLYFSSGSSTPGSREYSLAESLIVRGRIPEAIEQLENACATYPADPDPALRLARLLRDRTETPAAAARWFRIAIERSGGDAGQHIGALREIIELRIHVLGTPRRALPDLARLAAQHPDTPAAAWARREMAEIRQSMQDGDEA